VKGLVPDLFSPIKGYTTLNHLMHSYWFNETAYCLLLTFYENAAERPVLSIRPDQGWTGMNAAVFEFDRQDILVLPIIFAEAGKPRLSFLF